MDYLPRQGTLQALEVIRQVNEFLEKTEVLDFLETTKETKPKEK